uniref:Dynein light chain n=1 Tax=Equus caballus TaxID=9796 RepID=A0A9L0RNR2_HORSE
MCDRKAVIKNADMSEEMQQDSVECATQALEKYNIEKDIAAHIKKVRTGRGPFARSRGELQLSSFSPILRPQSAWRRSLGAREAAPGGRGFQKGRR